MNRTEALSTAELASRARALAPVIREKAAWAEENRRLPEDLLKEIGDAGLFRLRVPARYDGYECDLRTVFAVTSELGRADGSTAWVVANYAISAWLVGLFPDDVQDEVFTDPDVRVAGILSPTGTATPTEGGVMLSGRWSFATGVLHSRWISLVAMASLADGSDGGAQPVTIMVPTGDLEIIDDWHTAGLRGTGSVTVAADALFVPLQRVMPMGPMLQEQYASRLNADHPVYRTPVVLTGAASMAGTMVGLARAAHDLFFERLPGRGITYTSYKHQSQAPVTHLRIAEASLRIDEAEFHALSAAGTLDVKAVNGGTLDVAERVRVRAGLARAFQLVKEAVGLIGSASGASSAYTGVPMQRYTRDVQTLSLHALLNPDSVFELYGRVLCGLEPNTSLL